MVKKRMETFLERTAKGKSKFIVEKVEKMTDSISNGKVMTIPVTVGLITKIECRYFI